MTFDEQNKAVAALRKVLDDNAQLLREAQTELAFARSVMEAVMPAQHALIQIEATYQMRDRVKKSGDSEPRHIKPADALSLAIEGISKILGDRTPLSCK